MIMSQRMRQLRLSMPHESQLVFDRQNRATSGAKTGHQSSVIIQRASVGPRSLPGQRAQRKDLDLELLVHRQCQEVDSQVGTHRLSLVWLLSTC